MGDRAKAGRARVGRARVGRAKVDRVAPPRGKRRLLVVLVLLTGVLLVADLLGNPAADAVRSASGAVFGPAQRVLSGRHPGDVARLEAENVRLWTQLGLQQHQLEQLAGVRELLDGTGGGGARTDGPQPQAAASAVGAGLTVVVAQVVASELSPLGGRSVTIDVGSRDGVTVDATVVAAAGLVGRVVAVSPWTSDVSLLGAAQSVVAVRVGAAGLLGTVVAAPVGAGDSSPGGLRLVLAEPGLPATGDAVTTMGSVGGRPYAAGITVGRVVAVDRQPGRSTAVGRVQAAVDAESLDAVAVVVDQQRAEPRPTTTWSLR